MLLINLLFLYNKPNLPHITEWRSFEQKKKKNNVEITETETIKYISCNLIVSVYFCCACGDHKHLIWHDLILEIGRMNICMHGDAKLVD